MRPNDQTRTIRTVASRYNLCHCCRLRRNPIPFRELVMVYLIIAVLMVAVGWCLFERLTYECPCEFCTKQRQQEHEDRSDW